MLGPPFLENQCCTVVPWSDLGAVIDNPIYFDTKFLDFVLKKHGMSVTALSSDHRTAPQHKFSKKAGFRIQKLHSKSVIFAVPLRILAMQKAKKKPSDSHVKSFFGDINLFQAKMFRGCRFGCLHS